MSVGIQHGQGAKDRIKTYLGVSLLHFARNFPKNLNMSESLGAFRSFSHIRAALQKKTSGAAFHFDAFRQHLKIPRRMFIKQRTSQFPVIRSDTERFPQRGAGHYWRLQMYSLDLQSPRYSCESGYYLPVQGNSRPHS